jgi:hypothetical protein
LQHIERGDARSPEVSDAPLIGPWNEEADVRANVAYFRKRRSATEHSYEDYAAYAADRVAEARDSHCTCGAPEKVAPGIGPYCTRTGVDAKCKDPYEPKVLKQALPKSQLDLDIEALENARPKLVMMSCPSDPNMECEGRHPGVNDIPTFEDHPVYTLNVKDIPALKPRFETKDSGQREDFSTGSRRDTRTGKGRYDLLPPAALRRLAQVYERGAAKYGDRNWELGQPLSRFLDSALRHTFQVLEGRTDEDHAGQAAWNLLAFIEIQHRINEGLLPKELNDL